MDINGDAATEYVDKLTTKSLESAALSDECSEPVQNSLPTPSNGSTSPDVNGVAAVDKTSIDCLGDNHIDSKPSESIACDLETLDDKKNDSDQDAANSNSSRNVEAANCDETDEGQEDGDRDGWIYVLGHDQLKKRTIKEGAENTRPVKGQRVIVRCVGHLDDGTEVDKYDKLEFVVGDDDFIHAFDLCIALVNKGEVCEIMTEARFAYGKIGREPDVPPNARILYEVELLDLCDEPEYHTMTVNHRLHLSDKKRERGNFLYSRDEFSRAVDVYSKAIKIVDIDEQPLVESADELSSLADMQVKCYSNLAAAQLKLEAWDAAIKSCDLVLLQQPNNVKALFRKGKCLAGKGNYDDAIAVLTKAFKLYPDGKDGKIIQQELARLTKICKEQNRSQRELYQKMMGTDKEPFIRKQPVVEQPDRRWVWYVLGALASVTVPLTLTLYRFLYGDDGNSSDSALPSSATSVDSSSDYLPTNTSVFTN